MYLFIGLGNPGPQYVNNRHNVGFMAIEEIRRSFGFSDEKPKFGGMMSEGQVDGVKVMTFRPLSFMNRSGIPSAQFASFYKIPLDNIYVFHDELDIPLGSMKLKQGGGAGGHNGLRSLDQNIGQKYWRVRIGIGHPGVKSMVSSYVLSDFDRDEEFELERVLGEIADDCHLLLSDNPNDFASLVMQNLK